MKKQPLIQLLVREKEALQNVIDMYLEDERKDAEIWVEENLNIEKEFSEITREDIMKELKTDSIDQSRGGHMYWELLTLQQILNRSKK